MFLCYKEIASAEPQDIQADWQPWDVQVESIHYKQEKPSCLSSFSMVKLLPLSAIIIYQKVISPQQGGVCNFIPSCSQFGFSAIKRYGIIQGVLMTSDRLQRCHYCVSGEYHYKPENGRFYDPVKNHCLSENLHCLEYGYVENVGKNTIIVHDSL
jgi:putative membrane protein insertion efficiency factor